MPARRYYSREYQPVGDATPQAPNLELNQYADTEYTHNPYPQDYPRLPDLTTPQDYSQSRNFSPQRHDYDSQDATRSHDYSYGRDYSQSRDHSPLKASRSYSPHKTSRSAYPTGFNQDSSPYEQDRHHGQRLPRRDPPTKKNKKKTIIIASVVALIVIIALGVGIGVGIAQNKPYKYTVLYNQVSNETAFTDGGATYSSPWTNVSDGIGAGKDEYTYYSGPSTNFPPASSWVSFENMWAGNLYTLQHACKNLNAGDDDS